MSHETLKLNRSDIYDPSESEILVSFKYHAGREATRENPAEPDEIEILKIECIEAICGLAARPGQDITDLISEAEYEYIENYLYDNWQAYMADAEADYRYEQYREERDRE